MRLGIYGGTFSPVHNAHVRAAREFIEHCRLDRLMIIPAGIPPHKSVRDKVTAEQRLQMCRLAFSDLPITEISDIELRRSGKSYTVMTVRELEKAGTELFLLCGTDMMLTFDSWYCFEEIMKKCTLVCIRRECDNSTEIELDEKIRLYREKYNANIVLLSIDALEMSSTLVRQAVSNGDNVSSLIPPSVLEYIEENKLYTDQSYE